jgi:hypothetical protein
MLLLIIRRLSLPRRTRNFSRLPTMQAALLKAKRKASPAARDAFASFSITA